MQNEQEQSSEDSGGRWTTFGGKQGQSPSFTHTPSSMAVNPCFGLPRTSAVYEQGARTWLSRRQEVSEDRGPCMPSSSQHQSTNIPQNQSSSDYAVNKYVFHLKYACGDEINYTYIVVVSFLMVYTIYMLESA